MPGRTTALAALSGSVFLALAAFLLHIGHPHEDAYILFLYSENLADTGVISYYPGGPRAEGATDFLWMIAIAGLYGAGLSSGMAAAVLNTFGVVVASAVVLTILTGQGVRGRFLGIVALVLPLASVFLSGYGGFSAPLFAGLGLLVFYLLWQGRGRVLATVPLLSIVLGLIRPDGVILGVVATLVGLLRVRAGERAAYLAAMTAALLIGAGYFLWRYSYFGELLPLPLLVKTASDALLPGLPEALTWLATVSPFAILAVVAVVRLDRAQRRHFWPALAPFAAHFVVLWFSVQSQNIAFRFQAPQALIVYAFALLGVYSLLQRRRWQTTAAVAALVGVQVLADLGGWFNHYQPRNRSQYITAFPQLLAPAIPPSAQIALTEAGIFTYWTRAETYDLVGLNTAETAREGASEAHIRSLLPDLLFMHTDQSVALDCGGANYCEIPADTFSALRRDRRRSEDMENRVQKAILAVLDHLESAPETYRIFAVRFWTPYTHLYALRRDGAIDAGAFLTALEASFREENRRGYRQSFLEMRARMSP